MQRLSFFKTSCRRFLPGCLRRLGQDRSGVAAVEFGLISVPFFMIFFAIMEVALMFFGTLMLDHGVNEAGRLVRTGQAQEQGFGKDEFKTAVCAKVVVLPSCETMLNVYVSSFSSFEDAGNVAAHNLDSVDDSMLDFDMGNAEDVVMVRVYYEWGLLALFPNLAKVMNSSYDGLMLSNMGNGNFMIVSSTAFRNEPFAAGGS